MPATDPALRAPAKPRLRLELECLSGNFERFAVVGRDEQGRTRWSVQEQSGPGIWMRLTRFRTAMKLVLAMDGPQGRFFLSRAPGVIKRQVTLQNGPAALLATIECGWLRWRLVHHAAATSAEIRFANPTLLGRDGGLLRTRHGQPLARFALSAESLWSGRYRCTLELVGEPNTWEPLAVALGCLRLAEKQQR